MALSVDDFAAKIKQKYPEYQDVDNTELTKKIVDKYPIYKDQVDLGGVQEVSGQGSTNTSVESEQRQSSSSEPSLGYNEWLQQNNINDVDPNGDGVDYDYKRFYNEQGGVNVEGHFTDLYKKTNHPTFSVESLYSNDDNKGGEWIDNEDGTTTFKASKFNLTQHSPQELAEYFREVEPNSNLVLPDGTLAYSPNKKNVIDLNGANAQINPDGSFLLEVDVNGTNVNEALNPNTNPNFVESVKNSASNLFNRLEGVVPRLNVVSADLFSNVFGDEIAKKIYDNDPIRSWFGDDRALEDIRSDAYKKLTSLDLKVKPTQGLVDNIQQGNIQNIPAAAVDAMSSLVSTAIPSFLTGGAGLYTEMVGDAIVDFNEAKAKRLGITVDELYRQKKAEIGVPLVIGTVSGVLEHIGLKGVQGAINRKLTGSLARKVATVLGDANKEGITEILQNGLDAANLSLANGESQTQAGEAAVDAIFSKQGLESYLMGVVGSLGASGMGRLAKSVVNANNRNTANEIVDQTVNLQEQLNNTSINPTTREVLQQQINTNQQELIDIVSQDVDSVEQLPQEMQDSIEPLMSELEDLQESINDPNLSEQAKQALTRRSEEVSTQIDNIISSETPVQQNEQISSAEQTGVVNTNEVDTTEDFDVTPVLTQAGFTEQESSSFLQDLTTQEGRTKRLNDSAARIQETWQRLSNQGIANNPEENSRNTVQLLKDLTEYASVAIVDGTIRTARQLANAVGITYNDTVQQAYDTAREISNRLNKTIPQQRTARQSNSLRNAIDQNVEGGITGSVNITNKQALRSQISTLNRGIRMGMQNAKESQNAKEARLNQVRENVTNMINSFNNTDLFKGATVPANLVPRLVKRLSNAKTETALLNFSEYLEKIVDDIDYDNKARQATENANKLRSIEKSSSLKSQIQLRPLLRRIAEIGRSPSKITDIDEYNDITSRIIDRQGNIRVSNEELNAYINKEISDQQKEASRRETEINEAKKQAELDHIQSLIDENGLEGTAEDYWEAVKAHEDSNTLVDLTPEREERENLTDRLKEMVNINRRGLPSNADGLNSYESNALEAFKSSSLDNLTNQELRGLNTAISNAVINGDYITGTTDIVQRYNAKQESTKWLTNFKDKLNTIVQGTSNSWNIFSGAIITPNRMKLDTNQLFRAMSSVRDVGESLYGYIMGDVDRGYTRAKQTIDKYVKSALNIYDKNKLKSQDSYDVGAALYLLNYESDGRWASPQEAYETKKAMVGQSVELLRNTLATRRDNISRVERRKYEREIKNLTAVFNKANQYYLVENFQENFLNDKQKPLYDHIINSWLEQGEAARIHFQKLGVKFTESDLYAPISYNRIITSDVQPSTEFGIDTYHRAGAIDNEGKHVAERQNVRQLPIRKTGTGQQINMYLNLDAIRNFDRELSRRLIDIETMDARVKAKYLLSDNDLKNAIDRNGEVANHENIVWKTEQNIKDLNGISGFINDYDQNLDAIVNQATRLFYRGAVGSFTQLINQSIPNIPSVWANTSIGSWSQATKIMLKLNQQKIYDLIRNSEASAYNRLSAGSEDRMMNAITDMENEMDSNLSNGINNINRRVGDITYAALQSGDNINTLNSWMSGYIESLKKQGVIKKSSEFTDQLLEEHINNPNKEAAQYADGIASSINATVRRASRAEAVKARSISQRILNSLIGNPLKSFSMSQNMEARLAFKNLIKGDYTGRDVGIIGAYLANTFVLANALRYVWSWGFQSVGASIAGMILGGDDDDKADERRLKDLGLTKDEESKIKTNRKIISMLAQGVGNVLFGSQPIWLEQGAQASMDLAYTKLILPHFQKSKNKKDAAKETLPATLFFTSSDNVFGVGVLDSYAQLFNTVDKLATDPLPIDEEAAAKLTALRVVTGAAELGILGADFKRLSQQTLYSVERTVKDGYYKMSNSYGTVKDAVNKYGIKPITPFNTKELYLEDSKGQVKSFVLSSDEVSEINKEIGKEMNNLLPSFGYGKSIDSFNKSKYTIEDINKDMSEIKSEATRNVIERRFKGYYKSSRSKFNKQEQEVEE